MKQNHFTAMRRTLAFLLAILFPVLLFAGSDSEAQPAASPWGDKAPRPVYSLDGYVNNPNIKYLYFSGDLLNQIHKKQTPFCIGTWDVRDMLPKLTGLLVMGTTKKSAIKQMQRDIDAIDASKKFETLAHTESLRIYGHHRTAWNDSYYDEVVVFTEMDGKQTIIQLFGVIRAVGLKDLISTSYIAKDTKKTK